MRFSERGNMCLVRAYIRPCNKAALLICANYEIIGKPCRRIAAATVNYKCWVLFH